MGPFLTNGYSQAPPTSIYDFGDRPICLIFPENVGLYMLNLRCLVMKIRVFLIYRISGFPLTCSYYMFLFPPVYGTHVGVLIFKTF